MCFNSIFLHHFIELNYSFKTRTGNQLSKAIGLLSQWSPIGSMVEPHERIELNRLTRLCHSIFTMKISYYIG